MKIPAIFAKYMKVKRHSPAAARLNRCVAVVLLIITFAGWTSVYAQNSGPKQEQVGAIDDIFQKIETGINKNDVSLFAEFFSTQTYLSLSSGQTGYYSANQCFYIIQEFIKQYQPNNFKFSFKSKDKSPYATAVYQSESSGRRKKSQVFISLARSGSTWKIAQFTIR